MKYEDIDWKIVEEVMDAGSPRNRVEAITFAALGRPSYRSYKSFNEYHNALSSWRKQNRIWIDAYGREKFDFERDDGVQEKTPSSHGRP